MRNPSASTIPEPALKPRLAYSEVEAAALIGLSPRTLFTLRQANRIAFIRCGERVIYRAAALREFLRNNETPVAN